MNTEATEEKGISFVSQIDAAYAAVVAAEKNSLKERIKLGELLNLAKGAVGHGPWSDWLKKHCPNISHRSANVYMQLADKQEKLKSNSQHAAILADGAETSIRQALREIRPEAEKRKAKRRAIRGSGSRSAGRQLLDLNVDGVFELLVKIFDQDFLDTLDKRLAKHLKINTPETEEKSAPEAEEKDDSPHSPRREFQPA